MSDGTSRLFNPSGPGVEFVDSITNTAHAGFINPVRPEVGIELGAPLSRVLYILQKRRIKPIGRAGILRLYDRSAVETVREALREMDERQGVA